MARYFMTVDSDGRLTGAYSDAHKSIPDGAIEVDRATHSDWVQNQETRRWNAGKLEICEPRAHVPTWGEVRAKRDKLLVKSDWVVLRANDRGDPVPPKWLAYREALRDIPQTYADPALVVWPTVGE